MFKHASILLVLLIWVETQGEAQDIDSLEQVFQTYQESDSNYIKLLNDTGFEFWSTNPGYFLELSKRALTLAIQNQYRLLEGESYVYLGIAFWANGKYDEALKNLFLAIKIFEEDQYLQKLTWAYGNIALVYDELNNYNKALEYHKKSLEFKKKLAPEKLKSLASSHNNIGAVYHKMGLLDSAYDHYQKSLKLREQSNHVRGIAESYNNLGVLFQDKKQPELARVYYLSSIKINKEVGHLSGLASTYNNLGKLQTDIGSFNQAKIYLDSGLYYGIQSNAIKWMVESYSYLTQWALQKNDYKNAYEYDEQYDALRDSLINLEKAKEIARLEANFKNYQKQNEIEFLEKENTFLSKEQELIKTKNNLLILALVLITILSVISIVLQRSRFSKATQLQEANNALNKIKLENSKLREEDLERQLEFKNRELASYTMNFIQKNELLSEIKETTDSLMAKNNLNQEVMGGLKKLKKISAQNQTMEKDWEEFKYYFENVYNGFFSTLKTRFPNLTQNELKLASLIRLNRNVKETANILSVSPDSIKKARYRLRKKMGLQTEESLFDYLMSLTSVRQEV